MFRSSAPARILRPCKNRSKIQGGTHHVADSQSNASANPPVNPAFKQGIRIGSLKDGKVTAFIPETVELRALEGVAADDQGNVYGGYTNTLNFRRWVKQ
jgi:hypothetical protein